MEKKKRERGREFNGSNTRQTHVYHEARFRAGSLGSCLSRLYRTPDGQIDGEVQVRDEFPTTRECAAPELIDVDCQSQRRSFQFPNLLLSTETRFYIIIKICDAFERISDHCQPLWRLGSKMNQP